MKDICRGTVQSLSVPDVITKRVYVVLYVVICDYMEALMCSVMRTVPRSHLAVVAILLIVL